MLFSNVFVASILAVTAAAMPAPNVARSDPTSTSSSTSASASSTSGGGLKIINNMDATVYVWDTSSSSGSMESIDSNGGTREETWQTNSNGGGISIKFSTSQNEDSVLQFEYTLDSSTLYWDLSSINLDSTSEFVKSGFSVKTNDDSCSTATCKAGDSNCLESYQKPDDVNTNSCSTSAEYTLTLG